MAPIDSSSSILIEFLLTVNIKDSRDSETGSQTDDYLYHGIDFLRQFQLNNKYRKIKIWLSDTYDIHFCDIWLKLVLKQISR